MALTSIPSARALAAAIAAGTTTAADVLEAHLARIAERNPQLNAIVTLDADGARAAAEQADAAVARGDALGSLHGLPLAVKDLEDTAGMRTTYGSTLFAEHVPERDSAVVARLRAAGAIVVGKTNTPEFGAGSQTFNAVFGATRNPHDASLTPGGSSGGAAVAVATGMVALADGSDLAASVRNPASFCGVVGLRPTPGVIDDGEDAGGPMSELAVLGPIARSVDDAALLLGAMSGDRALGAAVVPRATAGLRVAWSATLGGLPVARVVGEALGAARERLSAAGCDVRDAEPDLSDADDAFDVLRAAGFAEGLGPVLDANPGALKDTVVWNVERGRALSAERIADAEAARRRVVAEMRAFMSGWDVLALPTVQVAPFAVETEWVREIEGTPMEHYVAWLRSCSRITVTGHPAISIPAGATPDGLPIGLQLVGRRFEERALLEVAAACEAVLSQ